jgi:PST family polysaccharide transporter
VQSRYTVWIENGVFLFMAAIKVAMILSKANLLAFVWMSLVEAVLVAIGLVLIYVSKGGGLYACHPSIERVKTLLRDSWPLLLAGLAVTIYMRVDMLMLDEMVGSREVGIYAAATRVSEIWYFLPAVIVSSVSPSIIKCHSSDGGLYINRMRHLYFIMVWLAIALSLPLSLLSDHIIITLFGQEFKDAAPVLAIHLWASVAVFLGMASSQHLLVEQLQKISFFRTLIGLLCNVVLNYLLIPSMGAKGAAIATVISYFIATFSLALFKATRNHTLYLLLAPFGRS